MSANPYNLQHFVDAQADSYAAALAELKAGRKETHWMWYIFPQIKGLGTSPMAIKYAIGDKQEAVNYLRHPLLGQRLRACVNALLEHHDDDIENIMGYPDYLKLQSSMTLFYSVSAENSFKAVLDRFYEGRVDKATIVKMG